MIDLQPWGSRDANTPSWGAVGIHLAQPEKYKRCIQVLRAACGFSECPVPDTSAAVIYYKFISHDLCFG